MTMERTLVHVPKEDLEAAGKFANEDMTTRAAIIRRALREYILRRHPLFLTDCSLSETMVTNQQNEVSL